MERCKARAGCAAGSRNGGSARAGKPKALLRPGDPLLELRRYSEEVRAREVGEAHGVAGGPARATFTGAAGISELEGYRLIAESVPGIFYFVDPGLRLQDWNRRFAEVTGFSEEELAGRSALDFFAEQDLEEARRGSKGRSSWGGL